MAGKLNGKRILMIICPANFRDEEVLEPKAAFEGEGAEVTVASTRAGHCRGMLGAVVHAESCVKDTKADDYDAVVVAGGAGSPQYLWDNADVHKIVQGAKELGKVIGAICLSTAVLANAGILQGIEATVYPTPESKSALAKGGAKYVPHDVVASGKIITAEGPGAAKKFAQKIVEAMM
ncbi:MAG: DJ-1/PfpI family protein [bacterium]